MHHKKAGYRGLTAVAGLALILATACHRTTPGVSNTLSADGRPLLHNARYKDLLAWNLKTTVEPYENGTHKSFKWDDAARKALIEFAQTRGNAVPVDDRSTGFIASNVTIAVEAGCDDPMVHYLYIRFSPDETNTGTALADEMAATAKDLEQSPYPPIRRFYAAARGIQQFMTAYRTNAGDQPAAHDLDYFFGENMMATLTDKTMPAEESFEVAYLCMSMTGRNPEGYQRAYQKLEPLMFASWPNDSTTWLFKGYCYIQMAWIARGAGFANEITPQGWTGFSNNLAIADEALNKAWELDTKDERIPVQKMELAVAEEKPRSEMEMWFGRAMALDPNNSDACAEKLRYLQPIWYGSGPEMIAFGRECASNMDWGGTVPLTLVTAHLQIWQLMPDSEEKSNYWKQSEVWVDVKSAYDRFFDLNPTAVGYYHDYALYAYRAERWDVLNELIPKLEPVNYAFFGGRDAYDRMVQQAQEHAGNKK
jgi:hypothetical protein